MRFPAKGANDPFVSWRTQVTGDAKNIGLLGSHGKLYGGFASRASSS